MAWVECARLNCQLLPYPLPSILWARQVCWHLLFCQLDISVLKQSAWLQHLWHCLPAAKC